MEGVSTVRLALLPPATYPEHEGAKVSRSPERSGQASPWLGPTLVATSGSSEETDSTPTERRTPNSMICGATSRTRTPAALDRLHSGLFPVYECLDRSTCAAFPHIQDRQNQPCNAGNPRRCQLSQA